MSRRTSLEVWVGAFVLMALVSILVIALKVSNFQSSPSQPGYQISALFSNIGGLKVRAPVKISGVVVGRVTSIEVDKVTYFARVKMEIYGDYNQLPEDTSGSILTSGLLGDQYIGLMPGASEDFLAAGDQLEMAQSAIVLEELIGQFLTKFGESEN